MKMKKEITGIIMGCLVGSSLFFAPKSKLVERQVLANEPVRMTSLGTPPNLYFKSYEDYRCITDTTSPQYNYIYANCYCDSNGFMRIAGDLYSEGHDYYAIALGSYYGTEIGTRYRITTITGKVFYGILCDQKADCHTDIYNQYGTACNDLVEFVVNTDILRSEIQCFGSCNVFMPLNGAIATIERMDF